LLGLFICSDVGVNVANLAVGGRWTKHYVDENIFSGDLFSTHIAQWPVDEKILIIGLGTNGTSPNTSNGSSIVQDFNDKQTLINRYRSAIPNGKVIVTTEFPSVGISPGWATWYREASIQLAGTNTLVLDTQLAMPCYEQAVILGYMGDTVHYNSTGNAAWAAKIASLITQCASAAS
jgi:lysophospholipase L1-like esterase